MSYVLEAFRPSTVVDSNQTVPELVYDWGRVVELKLQREREAEAG